MMTDLFAAVLLFVGSDSDSLFLFWKEIPLIPLLHLPTVQSLCFVTDFIKFQSTGKLTLKVVCFWSTGELDLLKIFKILGWLSLHVAGWGLSLIMVSGSCSAAACGPSHS